MPFLKTTITRFTGILFLIFLAKSSLFGQTSHPKNLKINCFLPSVVKDSSDLNATIVIKNISNSSVLLYSELIEGLFGIILENSGPNIRLIVQQKISDSFQNYSGRSFVDPAPFSDSSATLDKISIGPRDSASWSFHLDSRYMFEQGNYRVKCIYRSDVHKNSTIESKWTYFQVSKRIDAHRYFDEESKMIHRR